MAYRIEYTTNVKYQPPTALQWDKLARMAVIFFLLFLVVTCIFWPEGKIMLQKMVFPGDVELTSQAFEVMLDQIRGGEALDEAVEAFCREILSGVEFAN